MPRNIALLGWIILVAISARGSVAGAQGAEPEAAMSEEVRRMHERLVALTRGEAPASDLRIEFMDSRGLSSHSSFHLAAGRLVSKEWKAPGAPMVQREGPVTDGRLVELLGQLIAKRYWTFEGTRFVPDAPLFLFRFYHRDEEYVDFRCDTEEILASPERVAIRDLFLEFVTMTELTTVPPEQ